MAWDPFQESTGPQGPFSEYGARHTAYGPNAGPQMPPPRDGTQGAWGAPGPGVNAPPLTLGEAVKQLPRQYWRILSKPGAASFDAEQRGARWDVIWAQVVGYSLISAILSTLIWVIAIAFLNTELNTFAAQSGDSSATATLGFLFLPAPFFGVLTFLFGIGGLFLGQGITYLLAKAFGGQGDFMTQMYTSLLYQVPIGLCTAVLGLIPFVGSIGALAGIYAYVLQTFQMMAVHRLTTGKAIAVVLIPVGAAFLLAFALIAVYFVIIFSALGALHPTQ